ncbi:SDR family NAD(P)-dependent oxidoreductase [Microcoleus sp. N3A4]|uniref:SDR family NAD(P)-dependent oxidoreductase n=1 Tax=Microcoleus sp. N3A4 TaxID=3055379 RepID=UPI002FD6C409
MNSQLLLKEKVALITGGSRGIGLAIAQAFVTAGAHVVIAAREQGRLNDSISALKDLAHTIDADNGTKIQVSGVVADVRDQGQVEAMVEDVMQLHNRIDILSNTAGRGGGGPTVATDPEIWYDIIDTNLHGVYRVTRAVLARSGMLDRRWGRIINMASTGGKQGVLFAAAYTASKHGVVGFTKSLGLELAKTGVTVNAICPGFVETDLAVKAREVYSQVWGITPEEVLKRFETRIPLGRYVVPEEVAPMAVYLASDIAAPILAQAINICGGLGNY